MNGGMWGGVKDAVSFMKDRVMNWSKRDEYMADLYFLEEMIWPEIKGSFELQSDLSRFIS